MINGNNIKTAITIKEHMCIEFAKALLSNPAFVDKFCFTGTPQNVLHQLSEVSNLAEKQANNLIQKLNGE